jgi:hypothetical protein
MPNFTDFIQELIKISPENIPEVAAEILIGKEDWCGMIRDYIAELSEAEFCRNVLRAHIAHVEPKVFLLYEEANKFQIILHHFDLPTFIAYWNAGRLGPHYHHFPFSTRLLQGSYYNWLFDNEGTLTEPQLKAVLQAKCQTGDVYTLSYDRFHCVLHPENDTMSLMVRGKGVVDPGHPPDPLYDQSKILQMRTRLLNLLSVAPKPQTGQLISFKNIF